ncbi:unnamed protein product [Peniophora sp. CBMAI 1063]|nr:unnamed protein product [Peniophora sp. CBMAI 1063]
MLKIYNIDSSDREISCFNDTIVVEGTGQFASVYYCKVVVTRQVGTVHDARRERSRGEQRDLISTATLSAPIFSAYFPPTTCLRKPHQPAKHKRATYKTVYQPIRIHLRSVRSI